MEFHRSPAPRAGSSAPRYPTLAGDAVWVDGDDGVYLKSNAGAVMLKGRDAAAVWAALFPHLTGRQTLAAICAKLPLGKRTAVEALILRLQELGIVHECAPVGGGETSRDALVEYVEAVSGSASVARAALATLRITHIHVVGRGDCVPRVVAELQQMGCEQTRSFIEPLGDVERASSAIEAADLVIYISDSNDGGAMAGRFARACRRRGKRFIAAVRMPPWTIVGPISGPERRGCIECVRLRLVKRETQGKENISAECPSVRGEIAESSGGSHPIAFRIVKARVLLQVICDIAGLQGRATSDAEFLLVHPDGRLTSCHTVLPHERCPVCGDCGEEQNLALASVAALVQVCSRDVSVQPESDGLLDQVKPFVDEYVGLIRRLGEADFVQAPLVRSEALMALSVEGPHLLRSVSSGLTYHESRLRAVRHCLSRYLAASFHDTPAALHASVSDLLRNRLPVALPSELSGSEHEHEWSWGFELPTLRIVLAPKVAFLPRDTEGGSQAGPAIGVGVTFQELLEDLLRAAVRLRVATMLEAGETPVARLFPPAHESAAVTRLIKALRRFAVEPRLYAVEHGLCVPAVIAVGVGGQFDVAAGATLKEATTEALRRLLQAAQSRAHGEIADTECHRRHLPDGLCECSFAPGDPERRWTIRQVFAAMKDREVHGICVSYGALPLGSSRVLGGAIRLEIPVVAVPATA